MNGRVPQMFLVLLNFAPKSPTLRSCHLQKEFNSLLKLKQQLYLNPDEEKSSISKNSKFENAKFDFRFPFLVLLNPNFFTRSEEVRLGLGSAGL